MSTSEATAPLLDRAIARVARTNPWISALALAVAVALCWVVVYVSGGTYTATPHLFYLPIIVATVPFGLRGALVTAVVSAIAVGPFMPVDVAAGVDQQPISWLIRGLAFLLIGAVASLSLAVRERLLDQQLSAELRAALRRSAATGPGVDLGLLPAIPEVLAERRFHSVYQPIFSLNDGRLISVEALTRFDTEPARTPDLWFAAAAEVGLGVDLELAAIETALAGAEGLAPTISLSVNASPATIADPRLLEIVRGTHRRLIVEVTEHAVIEDYHLLEEHCGALRAEGVRIAVDDAGAGVASLQHIVQLTPEVIKLDMSLTQQVGESPLRRALAGALIEFAQASGALLVVEGIEEKDDLDVWTSLGAHAAQGYLVGRPGPLPTLLSSPLIAQTRTR